MKINGASLLFILMIALGLSSCSDDEVTPKPHGYFRIDLPEKAYTNYDSKCPISFEIPNYAQVELYPGKDSPDSCQFNISLPKQNAKLYCSYIPLNNNFEDLVKVAYQFAATHEMKASALKRTTIDDPQRKMYGIFYDIEGSAASQCQFFLSDSTNHFFRGSLYFNSRPNPDSIAPVLAFVRQDLVHMVETMKWR
jgi:gliding motility-associated lipoprotein GldD